jgi:ATP-dependent Lon protease
MKRTKNDNNIQNKKRKFYSSNSDDDEYLPTLNKNKNIILNTHDDLEDEVIDMLDKELLKKYSKVDQKKYKSEYDKIKQSINDKPTVLDIISLNASFKEKCYMVQLLDILVYLEPNTFEYMETKQMLKDKIKEYENLSEIENKLEKELMEFHEESLKSKILNSKFSTNIKSILFTKYVHMSNIPATESGHHKIKEWLEYALKLPTESVNINLPNKNASNKEISDALANIQKLLDTELYGLNNVKEDILTFLCNKITNSENTGNALALLGAPGTGKTCLVRSLAKSLNIPFTQISMGGSVDTTFLDGHNYTYEGAGPGIIVKSLINMGCNNGIIFFDEIDKLSESEHGKEVAWNLLHITDFSQNNEFRDKYLDFPIDLSKIWFIYSMNDISNMDKALIDRMPVLEVSPYDNEDKVQIAKNYMIPKIMQNIGLNLNDVKFSNDVLLYIVSKSFEPGVRDINKMLNTILKKINLFKCTYLKKKSLNLSFNINNFKIPLIINKKIVDELI